MRAAEAALYRAKRKPGSTASSSRPWTRNSSSPASSSANWQKAHRLQHHHSLLPAAGAADRTMRWWASRCWHAGTSRRRASSRRTCSSPSDEDSGLIGALTLSILKNACHRCQQVAGAHQDRGEPVPSQLKDIALPDHYPADAEGRRFPPQRLEIEITETALVDDDKTASSILSRLRSIGHRHRAGRFRHRLFQPAEPAHVPVNKVKIDKSFVRSMNQDGNSKRIITGILAMSRCLGIRHHGGRHRAARRGGLSRLHRLRVRPGILPVAKPMKADEVPRFLSISEPALSAAQ